MTVKVDNFSTKAKEKRPHFLNDLQGMRPFCMAGETVCLLFPCFFLDQGFVAAQVVESSDGERQGVVGDFVQLDGPDGLSLGKRGQGDQPFWNGESQRRGREFGQPGGIAVGEIVDDLIPLFPGEGLQENLFTPLGID
jgi:hypothetical protein